jgi:hypothetical protein
VIRAQARPFGVRTRRGTARPGHRVRGWALLFVAFGLLLGPLAAAPAASAAQVGGDVIDCLNPAQAAGSNGACTSVQPTFSCVWDNGGGSYTAALGYINRSQYTLEMPVGSYDNSFYGKQGDPADWGQPSLFPPGSSTTFFTVTWTQPWQYTIQWQLGDEHVVSFSSASTPCTTSQVPMVASVSTLGAAVLVIMGIFVIANRRAEARNAKALRAAEPADV